jgi:hypothetical protein
MSMLLQIVKQTLKPQIRLTAPSGESACYVQAQQKSFPITKTAPQVSPCGCRFVRTQLCDDHWRNIENCRSFRNANLAHDVVSNGVNVSTFLLSVCDWSKRLGSASFSHTTPRGAIRTASM